MAGANDAAPRFSRLLAWRYTLFMLGFWALIALMAAAEGAGVQRAWLGYRTEACNFESSAAAGGSSQQMIRWQCTSRMTRERTAALASQAACREGDLSCVRPAGASSAPR